MRLRLPDFKTIDARKHWPIAPRQYSWYSFLLKDESIPGPQCRWKENVSEKFQWHHRERTRGLLVQCLNQLRHRAVGWGFIALRTSNFEICNIFIETNFKAIFLGQRVNDRICFQFRDQMNKQQRSRKASHTGAKLEVLQERVFWLV